MSDINIMEEIKFLLEVQERDIGTSSHDYIEVYCKSFTPKEYTNETNGLIAETEINMRRINWEKWGKYMETMLYDGKLTLAVDKIIIEQIKKIIAIRIKELREQARNTLGLNELREEELISDVNTEEGGTL